MEQQATKTLAAVLRYADLGWRLIPLHNPADGGCSCSKRRDCPSPGKHPRHRDWQKEATADEEKLITWFEKWPAANVGLVMGPTSGIIDVEFDSDEGAETAKRLFGECYTPTYKSNRSVHRLLKWSGDLPNVQKVLVAGLEVRIGGGDRQTQSVIPPSRHYSGANYEWLPGLSPDDVATLDVPDVLLTMLFNEQHPADAAIKEHKPSKARLLLDAEAIEGDRNNSLYAYACRAARDIANLDDPQRQIDLLGHLMEKNIVRIKPPLPEQEVKDIHRKAIEFIKRERDKESNAGQAFTIHGLQFNEGRWGPGDWKLTIINSDPVMYRLTVPQWHELTADGSGSIYMTLDQYRDAGKVAAAVQAATHRVKLDDQPRHWPEVWNGKPGRNGWRGVSAILLDLADEEEPPSVDKRYVQVCEYLRAKLTNANPCEEPDGTGSPCVKTDGSIWFRWERVWQDGYMTGQFKREDVADVRRRLGLGPNDYKLYPPRGDARSRYCVFDKARMARLDSLIDGGRDGQ